jgi:hypothetical protein
MPLKTKSSILCTCQKCGKKFEVNFPYGFSFEVCCSLVNYPRLCPKCDFNRRAEDFNRRTI